MQFYQTLLNYFNLSLMKNRYNIIILTLLMFSSLTLHAQVSDSDSNNLRKNAVSFNIFGISPLLGVSYERILSDYVSFEVGVGIPSIGVGFKVFPKTIKEQKAMFHLGLTMALINSGDNEITGFSGSIIYFPLGLSYYGKNGFNLGLDGGPGILTESSFTSLVPYLNIKLGKRF